jgi:hypothetical protein
MRRVSWLLMVVLLVSLADAARGQFPGANGADSGGQVQPTYTVATPLNDRDTLLSRFSFVDMFRPVGGFSNSQNRSYSNFPKQQVVVGDTEYLKNFGYNRPYKGKTWSWWQWPWLTSH